MPPKKKKKRKKSLTDNQSPEFSLVSFLSGDFVHPKTTLSRGVFLLQIWANRFMRERETLRVHQRSTRWRRARHAAYELMWILNSPVDASRLGFQTKLCRYFTKIANAIGARAPVKATRAPTTLLINCYDLAINVRNWRFSAQLALMCWRRVVVRQSGLSKADLMCWGKGRR